MGDCTAVFLHRDLFWVFLNKPLIISSHSSCSWWTPLSSFLILAHLSTSRHLTNAHIILVWILEGYTGACLQWVKTPFRLLSKWKRVGRRAHSQDPKLYTALWHVYSSMSNKLPVWQCYDHTNIFSIMLFKVMFFLLRSATQKIRRWLGDLSSLLMMARWKIFEVL